MSETIRLHGGPADGQIVSWAGGDELHIQPMRVLDFSVQTVEPFRFERAIYRRSLITRSAFVFQP